MQQQQLALLFLLILNEITQICMQGFSITSPCPEIFRYRFDGTEWFGILTIRDPSPGQPLLLNVALSVRGKPATNYLGEIELITRGQFLSDAPVLYKVKFPKTHFPPKLLQIKVNKEIVCYGTAEQAIFVTQIQLEHTRKFTFMPDDTSLPLSTGFGMPLPATATTDTNAEHQQNPLNEAIAGGYHNRDEVLAKTLAFGNKNLPLTKFNAPMLRAKDICGTIDNRIRFQRGKIMANKFRRAAGDVPIDDDVYNDNQDVDNGDGENDTETDYHNDAEVTGATGIPLVTTADISLPLSNEAAIKSAIEHLPSITRGAWPWLAAVYVNNLTSLFYQCGGTLISAHIVISSAHCLATSDKTYTANELLVFLGRHNLNNWNEESSLAAPVDDIFIHPQFNKNLNSYDADIAVLVLKNPVTFNTFIRPACLWSGATNNKYINGEQGIVVGWGSTRAQSLFSNVVPRVIEAPIVSNDVCFKANEKYSSLSSNRTFCAGIVFEESLKPDNLKLKGKIINVKVKRKLKLKQQRQSSQTGPCSGDSGAGLLILKNKRWILRGIVSASLPMSSFDNAAATTVVDFTDFTAGNPHQVNPTPALQKNLTRFACNVNQYVIYTDVAKFLDWIYAFII